MKTAEELWAEYVPWTNDKRKSVRQAYLAGVEDGRLTLVEANREYLAEELRKFTEGFAYRPKLKIEKAEISDGTGVFPMDDVHAI